MVASGCQRSQLCLGCRRSATGLYLCTTVALPKSAETKHNGVFQVLVQFCRIKFLTLPRIYSACAHYSKAIETNKVPMERLTNMLLHETKHDEYLTFDVAPPPPQFSEAIKTNKVPVERQINRL